MLSLKSYLLLFYFQYFLFLSYLLEPMNMFKVTMFFLTEKCILRQRTVVLGGLSDFPNLYPKQEINFESF